MYLIKHLKQTSDHELKMDEECSRVEYRLVCSGTLYPSGILGDWTKSDVARILLMEPFELIVASRPYDAYPQELALRFVAQDVTEKKGIVISIFRPDREIAADLTSLLTLLCRRLITVACRVRETFHGPGIPDILRDYPNPITTFAAPSSWRERPASVAYTLHGVEYRENQPPAVPFDAGTLRMWLERLPSLAEAEDIVRSARLYALALELIETRVEIAYQLLISAVETAAGASFSKWAPDPEEQLATRTPLIRLAKQHDVSDDVARLIALESCKGNPWSKRKFTKFLMDHVEPGVLDSEDSLFPVSKEFCPAKERFKNALDEVYSIRSGATHSGKPYPAAASIGPSWGIPSDAFDQVISGKPVFPPIGWFERITQNAIFNWINSVTSAAKPETKGS